MISKVFMLSKKNIIIPVNLINLAKKTPSVPVGIVCANHKSTMNSLKKAYEIGLINPIFIGQKKSSNKEARNLNWNIDRFKIIDKNSDEEAANEGALLAAKNKIKVLIKGNLHTEILMKIYLKKEFGLISKKRLSHIWHMSLEKNDKPFFITDGALNVSPRLDVKMHILKNVIEFANKAGIKKPKVAILSGTEDPIESMPSSIDAKELMNRAIKEKINAHVQGPLAFDNAVSSKAAKIKKISGSVAGKADIILVPNLETGNSLSKLMVYFLGACAAGIVVGGKVPVVVPSRADSSESRVASIAAAIIAAK